MEDMKRYYLRLKRKDAGLSQLDAAGEIGISIRILQHYENNAKRIPDDVLARMADVYDAPDLVHWYLKEQTPLGKFLTDKHKVDVDGEYEYVDAQIKIPLRLLTNINLYRKSAQTQSNETAS